MLNIQAATVECPDGGRVTLDTSIELTAFSASRHDISVTGPEGRPVPCRTTDKNVQFQYLCGPGVARFEAVIRDRTAAAAEEDRAMIEVLVLPETEPAVRDAIAKVISNLQENPNQAQDVSAEVNRLHAAFGKMATIEILRRLALDPDVTTYLRRCLFLLADCVGRTSVADLQASTCAALATVASSASQRAAAEQILAVMARAALPLREKWLYLMRTVRDLNSRSDQRGRAIDILRQNTPSKLRTETAATVLDVCTQTLDGRSEACTLFADFAYGPAVTSVLEWMQQDEFVIPPACKFLLSIDHRDAIPTMVDLLDRPGFKAGDPAIIDCLSQWKHREALPLILVKMSAVEPYRSGEIAKHVLRFGDEVVGPMREIQQRSSGDKAKHIAQALDEFAASGKV